MHFIDEIKNYEPRGEAEEADKKLILDLYKIYGDTLTKRECLAHHMSSSAWICNKDRTKVLLNYHNLYQNWGWLGGHADGEVDMLKVIKKEVREESGLIAIKPLMNSIASLEILPVGYHIKNNKFVPSHLHLNVTYLFEADEKLPLRIKPDENSGLKWVNIDDIEEVVKEKPLIPIYLKLNKRIRELQ